MGEVARGIPGPSAEGSPGGKAKCSDGPELTAPPIRPMTSRRIIRSPRRRDRATAAGVSFNDLISTGEERGRDREAQGFGCLHVYNESNSSWLLNRQICERALLTALAPMERAFADAVILGAL